jgi:uncharacterized repeat protein (TIGR02543 family)
VITVKKSAVAALLALLFASIGQVTSANAATVTDTVSDISYSANDANVAAGATVTGYSGSSSTPTIPSSVVLGGQTYAVKVIGNAAFQYSTITGITLPDSLTRIEDWAFDNSHLVTVTIPNNVTYVGTQSFSNEEHLTSVTFGSSVESIKYAAFANVAHLTSIEIPASVHLIEQYAFGYSPGIIAVAFDGSVATIATKAFFSNENNLATIDFYGGPPGSMGDQALGNGVVVVHFPIDYLRANYHGGFTFPTWHGLPTSSIAMVRFNVNGGDPISPPGVTSYLGETINEPTTPTRDGYTFEGWYTSRTGGHQWDFSTEAVLNKGTLFARWSSPAGADSSNDLAATGFDAVTIAIISFALLAVGVAMRRRSRRS